MNTHWKSGELPALRSGATAETIRPTGRSALASRPGKSAPNRDSTSVKAVSGVIRQRVGTAFITYPMTCSRPLADRLATGVPSTRSSAPVTRPARTAKALISTT